jgi:hypothetical protein
VLGTRLNRAVRLPQGDIGWRWYTFQACVSATSTVQQKHSALIKFFTFLEEFQESEHAGQPLRALPRLSPPRATPPRRETNALEEGQVQRIIGAAYPPVSGTAAVGWS